MGPSSTPNYIFTKESQYVHPTQKKEGNSAECKLSGQALIQFEQASRQFELASRQFKQARRQVEESQMILSVLAKMPTESQLALVKSIFTGATDEILAVRKVFGHEVG